MQVQSLPLLGVGINVSLAWIGITQGESFIKRMAVVHARFSTLIRQSHFNDSRSHG